VTGGGEPAKRRRLPPAGTIVGVALALILGLAWLQRPAPRWHVVVVDLGVPSSVEEPAALPRLLALGEAGARIAWPGPLPPTGERAGLAQALTRQGWTAVEAGSGRGAELTEASLSAAFDAVTVTAAPLLVQVDYSGSSAAEADRELGRLVDGLAAPLQPSKTLFVVLDRPGRAVVLAGPRRLPKWSPPALDADLTDWLLALLGLPG
jgi:hypothetical protein